MVPSPRPATNSSVTPGTCRAQPARLHATQPSAGSPFTASSITRFMPTARASDGVRLHYEESGQGEPLLFVHEFAGDHRSWVLQVSHFKTAYRCLTYAARGYPPSDVPTDVAAYSQARAVEDAVAVLDAAGVEKAHVVGLSMGGFAALHLVLNHSERVRSAVVAGV